MEIKDYKTAIEDILKDSKDIEAKLDNDPGPPYSYDPNGYRTMYDRIAKAVPTMMNSDDTIKLLPMVVYGWMPTVLRNSIWNNAIPDLLRRENGEFSNDEMETLRKFVNNSYIGLSKLLHFAYPKDWAIWDSNVYAAIEYFAHGKQEEKLSGYCKNNNARVNDQTRFHNYQKAIRKVAKGKGKTLREIEMLIFYVGRDLKDKVSDSQ